MGRSTQELAADKLLQPADLPAECGLGDVQPVRGAPEVELLGDRDKGPQMT